MTSFSTKWFSTLFTALFISIFLAGCSTTNGTSTAQTEESETEEEFERPNFGIPESSPLAKIENGMTDVRVRDLIGSPVDVNTYQTGKSWIPYYYGPDTHRAEWIYPGEGRVVFSINRYSGALKVINVLYNPNQS